MSAHRFQIATSTVTVKQCRGTKSATAKVLLFSDGSHEIDTLGVNIEEDLMKEIMRGLPRVSGLTETTTTTTRSMGCGNNAKVQVPTKPASDADRNEVQRVFKNFDKDESRYLEPSEFKSLCSELLGKEITADSAMFMLQAMDKDKNQKISVDELAAHWPGVREFLNARLKDTPEQVSTPSSARPTKTPATDAAEPAKPQDTSAKPSPDPYAGKKIIGGAAKYMTDLEKAVFHEVNIARTQPHFYADLIEKQSTYIKDSVLSEPEGAFMRVTEPEAWPEAVKVLREMTPLQPLKKAPLGLYLASKDHARDQARTGEVGHTGKDGSSSGSRCKKYGSWGGGCGENISYGCAAARGIMMQLIIDDSVPCRGHRTNIYNPGWTCGSIACGPHKTYAAMCVQNFACSYGEGKKTNSNFARSMKLMKKTNGIEEEEEEEVKPVKTKQPVRKRNVPVREEVLRVYTASECERSKQAVALLDEAGVQYDACDIDNDESYFSAVVGNGFEGGAFQTPIVVEVGGKAHWDIDDIGTLLKSIIADEEKIEQAEVEAPSQTPLEALLSKAFKPVHVAAIKRLFSEHTQGGLTKDEADAFLTDLHNSLHLPVPCDETQRSNIVSLFRSHDKDRNGRLSTTELAEYLTSAEFAAQMKIPGS